MIKSWFFLVLAVFISAGAFISLSLTFPVCREGTLLPGKRGLSIRCDSDRQMVCAAVLPTSVYFHPRHPLFPFPHLHYIISHHFSFFLERMERSAVLRRGQDEVPMSPGEEDQKSQSENQPRASGLRVP